VKLAFTTASRTENKVEACNVEEILDREVVEILVIVGCGKDDHVNLLLFCVILSATGAKNL